MEPYQTGADDTMTNPKTHLDDTTSITRYGIPGKGTFQRARCGSRVNSENVMEADTNVLSPFYGMARKPSCRRCSKVWLAEVFSNPSY